MNDFEQYPIEAKDDFIKKISQANPINAVAELIWNGLDADAYNVYVNIIHTLDCVSSVEVKDDGKGIPHIKAKEYFTQLGNSWKKAKHLSDKGRVLHGKEGKGRLKAKALGRVCDWTTIYKENNEFYTYTISMIDENVKITNPNVSPIKKTGTVVKISELIKDFTCFDEGKDDVAISDLTDIFAIYLQHYKNISIFIGSNKLDVSGAIKRVRNYPLDGIFIDNEFYQNELEIIEWNLPKEKKLYLCNKAGFPLLPITNKKYQMQNYSFSAYLKSSYIDKLSEENIITLSELDENVKKTIDEAISKIKEAYRAKLSEDAQTVVDQWKKEDTYPYKSAPKTIIETATRQMFDIVAVNVSSNISDFMDIDKKSRAFQLRLLKEIVEKSPEDIQDIVTSVLDLQKKDRETLASLLKNTNLSSIISMAQKVTNRIHFINGIEELLFNPAYQDNFLERKQLQKLLEENTWFFGEEYHLVGHDESLTKVLKKYANLHNLNVDIDTPVKSYRNKTRDVIDLMIAKTMQRTSYMEQDNLVIELKSPKQPTLTNKEVNQIEEYATAVANDERFQGVKAHWNFFVISNKLDAVVAQKVKQNNRPIGLVNDTDNIRIWVKTWAEIIQENKERHKFLAQSMDQDVTKQKSLEYLRDTHKQILKDLIDEGLKKEGIDYPKEENLFQQN